MTFAPPFAFATTPEIQFGAGKLVLLPTWVASKGRHVLVVTGKRSFLHSVHWHSLRDSFIEKGLLVSLFQVEKEPSPSLVDACVATYKDEHVDVVVAIGGGSVLDAGKAISAMLPLGDQVHLYLEGIGTKQHPGTKVPFIAIPTTAGTGSEATKNAVLSEVGEKGFKKSLRHAHFVPDMALIDPELMLDCPPSVTGSSGMDAFTQLLESYLSTAANPMTDALALEGLSHISRSLLPAFKEGHSVSARSGMALAALLSGITLANAGLGLVHGFASSIGGYFDIPHGVVCSRLMYPCNKLTVQKLRKKRMEACAKYANVGQLFYGEANKSQDFYVDFLLDIMAAWTEELKIPRLSQFGVTQTDFERILHATENKSNPIPLEKEEIQEALEMAL